MSTNSFVDTIFSHLISALNVCSPSPYEAADKDEAVRVASLHPAATLGESVGWGIEVHPIGFFEKAS